MNFRILVFVLAITLAFVSNVQSQFSGDYLSIQELNETALDYGTYHVVGYVVKKIDCPVCPRRVQCKPCDADKIVISGERKVLKTDDVTDRELIIFVENSKKFKLKTKYMFLIQVLDVKTLAQNSNNVRLVYSEKIE